MLFIIWENILMLLKDRSKAISIIDRNTVNENRPRTNKEDDVYYKAWNAKGLCYLNLKQYEEALKCYLKVKESRPQYAVAYMNIAEVFYELGHFSESEHYYEESISISNTVLKSIEQQSLDRNMKEEQERQLRYISWAKIGKAWLFANTNKNKEASDLIV